MSSMTPDDLLWNWARWCWSGTTVGNMQPYVPWEDDHRPIMTDHARTVDELHQTLPWHERMVIIAEYPQKNKLFADMHTRQRMEAALRWIAKETGVYLKEPEYRLYLGLFKDQVGRELL